MVFDVSDIDRAPIEPFCIGDRVESFHPQHKYMIRDAKVGEVVSMERDSSEPGEKLWFVWVRAENGRKFAVRPSQLAVLGADDLVIDQPYD